MCDHSNAQTIVEELLQYLEKADYSIRETLVGGGGGGGERERERETKHVSACLESVGRHDVSP